MEEGTGGCGEGERLFFWVAEEWEVSGAHFCQFKQRHLSEGASAAGLLARAYACVRGCD